jgi:hypothetical protein
MKLLIFIGVNVGGILGWWVGEHVCGLFGLSQQTSFLIDFIISGLGSVAGVYAGWWAARKYL